MIEIRLLEVAGLASALQALHLPFGKGTDSVAEFDIYGEDPFRTTTCVLISKHDEKLLRNLIKGGDEHAKVTRGITAYLEITAPRFWWQEMDTYKVGRETLSSESTMHIQGKGLKEEELVKMKNELTEGTMQKRVVMFSYQTLRRIYHQRKRHRLPHWRVFCRWLEHLPYSWLLQ